MISESRPAESVTVAAAENSAAPDDDLQKLIRLWNTRAEEKASSDYPVGAGDVVEISVPAIDELRVSVVRISGDGSFSLPFIGKIQAAGMTEEQLRQTLLERLREYMYNPRAVVFVREYRSRRVAVLGSVMKPGLYSLTSGADTLLDSIAQAGGIAPGTEAKLYLIPAEPVAGSSATELVSLLPDALLQQDPSPLILKRTDPILIDLRQVSLAATQRYLSLPVRPGDVIMVPGGGQVLVEGWVGQPGAYNFLPGLSVTGAIAQAGGQMFPADVSAIKVIRAEKNGLKSFIMADLQKIKRGEATDIPLQGGDIVQVSAQTSKLIPYGLYRFFSSIINVGVGGTVPIVR
ncbi:MAG TPA: polysaccharide biosynthesis/export family protein [Candidatus Binatia bacterium]